MTPPLSGGVERLDDQLRPLFAAPRRAAVLTDFDGTLAPIVADPDRAAPLPGVEPTLRRLVDRYARVGVISGRPVRYLLARLGTVAGLDLVGLYGLERADGDQVLVVPQAVAWQPAVETVAAAADREVPAGVSVERKGLAVTLHFRRSPAHAEWVDRFAKQQTAATGLAAHHGRQSVELRPPVEADKGTVVGELAAGCTAVCYLGDDLGDLPAFDRLDALRAAGVTTLAVAVESDEAPGELIERADLVVEGPGGVLDVLHRLAA